MLDGEVSICCTGQRGEYVVCTMLDGEVSAYYGHTMLEVVQCAEKMHTFRLMWA